MTASHRNLSAMSLEQKAGQMVMARTQDIARLEELLEAGHAGSFYFGMKGRSAEEVAAELNRLQALAAVPPMVAFGSAVTDCGTGLLCGKHMRIGATRSREIAYRLALFETREQRAYGFHIPGTPVLDVNTNPKNPIINTRAIGDDPELVTELGLEMLRGVIDGRGVTCTMHFPGHGATSHDSHIRIPIDDRGADEIRAIDLAPYRAAIPRNLINGVCTNHVHYPAFEPGAPIPATVSRRIITGLLREELGYDGLIMSDSLTMRAMKDKYGVEEGAVLAVCAGHDIILSDYQSDPGVTHRALVNAIRQGRIPKAQVDASVARILRLKQWLGLFDSPMVDIDRIPQQVRTTEMQQFAKRVAREAVTVLEDRAMPLHAGSGAGCLLIANGEDEKWDADMEIAFLPTFARLYKVFGQRMPEANTFTLAEAMREEDIGRALELASHAETVVFGIFTRVLCYQEDSIGIPEAYADLIRRVAGLGKRLILLNFGNPYIMKDLPRGDVSLCTYDPDCVESIEAAVGALFGDIVTTGKLPVRISSTYPFGHGL